MLRTRSPCWNPPRKKSWRFARSPLETPNEPRSASAWCQGTPRVLQGRAKNFEVAVVACQKENSLPRAGWEARSETANCWPYSREMLRTNRRTSDHEYVSVAAASRPGEVGTPSGLLSTARFSSSYRTSSDWVRSNCENGNEASRNPPTDRS